MSPLERTGLRLYGALLRLFPRDFREEEAAEARDTLRCMLRDEPGRTGRALTLLRALRRLPLVLAREWWEVLRGTSERVHRAAHGTRPNGRGLMEGTMRNARNALRAVRRNPGFGLTAVALVALGVGAVTTVFTVVDHVLLRPLPYPDPDRIVLVKPGASHSVPAFQDFQETGVGSRWAAVMRGEITVMLGDEPRAMYEGRVNPDFFEVFGASAAAGRLFDASDSPDAGAVVLAWGSWQREWGGDPDIVGRTIRVNGRPQTVVGVLDHSFSWPERLQLDKVPDLWRPMDFSFPELQKLFPGVDLRTTRGFSAFSVVARLAPGVSLEAAQAEFDALAQRRAEEWPEHYTYNDAPVSLPLVPLQEATVDDVRQGLGLLFGAVGLLLLVACANVAHLFLARGLERMHEMALRRALGAGRAALAAQLFVESLVVGLLGGLGGVALAWGAVAGFRSWGPTDLPRLDAVALDLRVMAFAIALSAATAVVFGMLPALQATRRDPGDVIRGDGPGITGGRAPKLVRSGLVVAEVALSVVLVASAGLLLRSYATLNAVDPGVETADVWTIPFTRIAPDDAEDWFRMGDAITNAVASVRGVRSATFGATIPLEFGVNNVQLTWGFRTPDGPDETVRTVVHLMSPTYFSTLGIELLEGGGWTDADRGANPAPVVMSAELARQLFGRTEGVVGRIVERVTDEGPVRFVVRGVAPDVRHRGVARTDRIPELYLPAWMMHLALYRLSVAAKLAPDAGPETVGALREAVWSVEPEMPVPLVRSLDEWVAQSTAGSRFQTVLLWSFGLVALLLAAGGLYGTLLYSVRQRRRELAIRMALGAPVRRMHGLVLRQGLVLGGLGAALGVAGALGASSLLESRLFGIERTDPVALGLTAGLLLATVVLASWAPALRAGRTDPMRTLNAE